MRRARFLTLSVILMLGVACSGHGPVQFIPFTQDATQTSLLAAASTQYPIPTAASHPQSITVGSDRNLWFVETAANKIGRITPLGAVTEYKVPIAASSPTIITPGSAGTLWFTQYTANAIGRITTSGAITEYRLPTPSSHPYGIVYGPDNRIWITESTANKIAKFNGYSFAEFTIPTALASPRDITVGRDGKLWFAESNIAYAGSITTSGSITQTATGGPTRFIAQAGDGALWLTDTKDNRIDRITRFNRVQAFALVPGSGPAFVARGTDGNAWFTDFSTNLLQYVDSTTHAVVTAFTAPAGAGVNGIVAGPDGRMWFTEYNANKIGAFTVPAHPVQFHQVSTTINKDHIAVGAGGEVFFRTPQGAGRYNNGRFSYAGPAPPDCFGVTLLGPEPGIAADSAGNAFWLYTYDSTGPVRPCGTGIFASYQLGVSGTAIQGSYIANDLDTVSGPDGWAWTTGLDNAGGGDPDNPYMGKYIAERVNRSSLSRFELPFCFDVLGTGPSNSVWAAVNFGGPCSATYSTIARLTTTGVDGASEEALLPGYSVGGLSVGNDGGLWFTDPVNNSIDRMATINGTVSRFAIPTANSKPTKLTLAADGALWFTELAGNKIGRITVSGKITEYTLPTGMSAPYDIAVPPWGANCTLCPIWFSYSSGLGYITY